jgi:hypothetical protein
MLPHRGGRMMLNLACLTCMAYASSSSTMNYKSSTMIWMSCTLKSMTPAPFLSEASRL